MPPPSIAIPPGGSRGVEVGARLRRVLPILGLLAFGACLIAFSTANARAAGARGAVSVSMVPNDELNPVFEAAVQATEEAIVNAMVGAETMTGINGHKVFALPHERLREVLKKYNRLQ